MKRAGVVTFFDHPNYGAVLQAYGMKYALEKLGCSVTFIRNAREPNSAAPEKDRRLLVLEALRHRRDALRPLRKPFTDFAEKYFRTEKLDWQHDVSAGYDFFIVGSDQVWNLEITGYDPFWFLDFAPPEKRFSYAASFGTDHLPENSLSWYRERLAGFANLSVREASGQEIIRELTGKEAILCPDPVLLPERGVWEKLMVPAEKAVVLYTAEFDAELYQDAKADAAARGLPLTVFGAAQPPSAGETADLSPESWLGSIANAAAVYTNSFHALVFSHIFHKNLRFRPLVRMKNRNSRLFSFIAAMEETPAQEESRPGLFLLKASGGREKADARLDALRRSGFACLQRITDSPFRQADSISS